MTALGLLCTTQSEQFRRLLLTALGLLCTMQSEQFSRLLLTALGLLCTMLSEQFSRLLLTALGLDIHGSIHRRLLSTNTNKMHLCNRIYYSKVY